MSLSLSPNAAWLALLVACIGTYACRAIGVQLSDKLNQASEAFRWLSAVTYAMVAALTVRMLLLPQGLLASVPLGIRCLICAVSIGTMLAKPTRPLAPALLMGSLLMVGYGLLR